MAGALRGSRQTQAEDGVYEVLTTASSTTTTQLPLAIRVRVLPGEDMTLLH